MQHDGEQLARPTRGPDSGLQQVRPVQHQAAGRPHRQQQVVVVDDAGSQGIAGALNDVCQRRIRGRHERGDIAGNRDLGGRGAHSQSGVHLGGLPHLQVQIPFPGLHTRRLHRDFIRPHLHRRKQIEADFGARRGVLARGLGMGNRHLGARHDGTGDIFDGALNLSCACLRPGESREHN